MNTDRQQIIGKIKKLLAKADDNRGNLNECKLAMSIAMRLMAQYKIEQAELKDKPAEAKKVARRSFRSTKQSRRKIQETVKDYESFNRGYERGQNTAINPAIA